MRNNVSAGYYEDMVENIRLDIERNGRLRSKLTALAKGPSDRVFIIEHKHPDTERMHFQEAFDGVGMSFERFSRYIHDNGIQMLDIVSAIYITEDDGTNYVITSRWKPGTNADPALRKRFRVDFGPSAIDKHGALVKGRVSLVEEAWTADI